MNESSGLNEKFMNTYRNCTNGCKNSKRFSLTNNRFIDIDDIEKVTTYWPFLVSGLAELNKTCTNGDSVSEDAFFKIVLSVVSRGKKNGRVTVLLNKNDNPLAYGIIFDNTEPFCKRSAVVYAVYSNKQCPTAVEELQAEAEQWATSMGFFELHAVSRRMNGSTIHLFERVWGFKRVAIVFKKEL